MRKLVLLVVVMAFIACGDDNKKSDPKNDTTNKDVQKEVPKDEPIVDLESFLKANNKPNSIKVNVDFGGKFDINEFSIYTDSVMNLVFKVDLKDANFQKNDYRIALLLRPHDDEKDKLTEASKQRKIDYDNLYSTVIMKEANGSNYIVFPVNTNIKDYRKIEALLYDTKIKGYLPGGFDVEYGLFSYLSNLEAKDGEKLDTDLGRIIELKKVLGYNNKKSKGVSIVLNTKNKLSVDELSNYRLAIHTYPFEEEKANLSEKSKKNKNVFDSWYFDIKMVTINGEHYIASYLDTPILDFEKMEFRLYDKAQKRYIGIPVTVADFASDSF